MSDDVSSSTRSPAPRRSRRPLWMALAMVVMAGGIAAAGWLAHEGHLGWRLCYPKTYQPDRARRILARQKEMRVAEAFLKPFRDKIWTMRRDLVGDIACRRLVVRQVDEWPARYREARFLAFTFHPDYMPPEMLVELNWRNWIEGRWEAGSGPLVFARGEHEVGDNVMWAREYMQLPSSHGQSVMVECRVKHDRVVGLVARFDPRELISRDTSCLRCDIDWLQVLWPEGEATDFLVLAGEWHVPNEPGRKFRVTPEY